MSINQFDPENPYAHRFAAGGPTPLTNLLNSLKRASPDADQPRLPGRRPSMAEVLRAGEIEMAVKRLKTAPPPLLDDTIKWYKSFEGWEKSLELETTSVWHQAGVDYYVGGLTHYYERELQKLPKIKTGTDQEDYAARYQAVLDAEEEQSKNDNGGMAILANTYLLKIARPGTGSRDAMVRRYRRIVGKEDPF